MAKALLRGSVQAKKKVALKKKVAKKIAKRPVKKPVVKKRRKPEQGEDIIFDSRVGKTDALFVSLPEPGQENRNLQPINSPLDPEIDQAIKEFDTLDSVKSAEEIQPEAVLPTPSEKPTQPAEPKKSFWQKLLFFKK